MNKEQIQIYKQSFETLCELIISKLKKDEHITLELAAEKSQFVRFNNAKVRQSGLVDDGYLTLNLICGQSRGKITCPFSGNDKQDENEALAQLETLRAEVAQLPEDPYLVIPENKGSSEAIHFGTLIPENEVVNTILSPVQGIDFTGLYSAGTIIRANINSAGQTHWFSTQNFIVDYSMITNDEKMVKGTFAGKDWDSEKYLDQINNSKAMLSKLSVKSKKVERGQYRVYLAPAAVADLVGMLSWGGVGEASIQQGDSALLKMRKESLKLSEKFTLRENFSSGIVPSFNNMGETAAETLTLIDKGTLKNTLINARTAKEYNLSSNAANDEEGLRSAEVLGGDLKQEDILKTLGTGLYLSNLHYLNWSDHSGGRITGMTRYACFWVENGELVAPIENLRFDETLYHFLGSKLVALTEERELLPETSSYHMRDIGGMVVPGMIVDDFTFNL